MSKLKFEPSDFHELEDKNYNTHLRASFLAQEKYEKWLESQPVVYGLTINNIWTARRSNRDTHTAVLVDITEIKPKECEHHSVSMLPQISTVSLKFYCELCKKELKPKNGWEVV